MEKKLEEIINRLEAVKEEVARLEALIAELKTADAAPQEEVAEDPGEPIDLTLDETDFAGAVPESVPEEEDAVEEEPFSMPEDLPAEEAADAPEPEPSAVDQVPEPVVPETETIIEEMEPEAVIEEPEPEAAAPEDGFFGLFGEELAPARKEPRGRRRRESIAEAAAPTRTVADSMAVDVAWRTDIPGPEVRSLRSAIALGDQVLFIARLFRKDSALYQDTVDRLNATATLADAIVYLSETFPEWDLASDDVYKFMMAVRRKIRK